MNINEKSINYLRLNAVSMIDCANSGHPGIALGSAPILYTLYKNHLNVTPKQPNNPFRDRFVMSAGHGSSLLYATLNAFGYKISVSDMKNFRQLDSITSGHPEIKVTPGVDCSTGPLGQGIATAVGMALAQKITAQKFDDPKIKLFDNKVYALCGEGCLSEGVSYEALSFAGNLNLNNLIVIYDCNKITIEGNTQYSFLKDIKSTVKSYDFNVFEVEDGNNCDQINTAINNAKKSTKPSFIVVNTTIGYGSVAAGTAKVHGSPLGKQGIETLKSNLNIDFEAFVGDKEILDNFKNAQIRFTQYEKEIDAKLKQYKKECKDKYNSYNKFMNGKVDLDKILKDLHIDKDMATREMGGIVLNHISNNYDNIIGGTADLGPSTKAHINSTDFITPDNFLNKNIQYGVREFAMSCISNGLALYSNFKPFASTFFVFSDYMKSGMRLTSFMNLPVTYILTHDSIAVGEDGPTHQPIEQLAMLRAMPNMKVFRPCNFNEVKASFYIAYKYDMPSTIVLSRQTLPNIDSNFDNSLMGGYIISKESNKNKLDGIIISAGSEVSLAIQSQQKLQAKGYSIRVVSMLSCEVFDSQFDKYKNSILPKDVVTMSVEAGSDLCWYKYVGKNGKCIGINEFGKSGDANALYNHFNITEKNITYSMIKLIKQNKK